MTFENLDAGIPASVQRTANCEPRTPTSEQRIGQGSLTAKRAILTGLLFSIKSAKSYKNLVATLLHYYTPYGVFVVVVAEHLAPTATTTNS